MILTPTPFTILDISRILPLYGGYKASLAFASFIWSGSCHHSVSSLCHTAIATKFTEMSKDLQQFCSPRKL